jgi:hypothetical protein
MKRVTPSDARKNWFRLLDEVEAGEIVVLERHGSRIVIRREDRSGEIQDDTPPDYSQYISAPNANEAERWGWDWSPDAGGVRSRDVSAP